MAHSMDPIQSFAYLVDNIPQWLKKLDDLNAQCDEQYERFYKLTRHGEVRLSRKKKYDSTESLRPPKDKVTVPFPQVEDVQEMTSAPATVTAALAEATQTPQPNTSAPLRSNQPTLKRKPASALSAASGGNGYRTKSMIVVYYDSAIQEGFESIVRNVSNARSNLRKGRTTATFQARMASMDLPSETTDTAPSTQVTLPSFGRRRENIADKKKFKAYDEADRDLEEAQNLAEKSAHQFLRDGDCKMETEATKKRLRAVQELAAKELEQLKAKAAEVELDAANRPESKEKTIEDILNQAYSQMSTPLSPSKTIEAEMPPKQMHFIATGAIEVDDAASDASSVKIDINAIRRVTRRAI